MFFALATAHVITDFVLQPDWMALAKKRNVWVLVLHVGITALGPVVLAWLYWPQLWGVAIVLAVVHLLVDWTKMRLESRLERRVFIGFLADQVVHLLSIAGVLMAFGLMQWARLASLASVVMTHRDSILRYVFVYSTSIFFGYVLIKIFFLSMPTDDPAGAENKYVGMLERGLITTFTALGQFLLIAAVMSPRLLLKGSSLRDPVAKQRLQLEILINIALAMSVGFLLR
jgi:hypothetical protein